MKKYFFVTKNTWDEQLTYRFNFVMWRVRMFVWLLTIYFLWEAIIPTQKIIFGYTQATMLTYVLGTSFISSIVLSSRTADIGTEINEGKLSMFLLKPMSYLSYWFWRDIGDKGLNIIFSLFELGIFFLLFHPPFFFQTNILTIGTFIIAICLGVVLYFLIGFLLGLIGFWSNEVWAPRLFFFIILNFFAGAYFPLDILPKQFLPFVTYSPFSYLLYFPFKVYQGQLPMSEIVQGMGVTVVWITFFYIISEVVWNKGLRNYTAIGL